MHCSTVLRPELLTDACELTHPLLPELELVARHSVVLALIVTLQDRLDLEEPSLEQHTKYLAHALDVWILAQRLHVARQYLLRQMLVLGGIAVELDTAEY